MPTHVSTTLIHTLGLGHREERVSFSGSSLAAPKSNTDARAQQTLYNECSFRSMSVACHASTSGCTLPHCALGRGRIRRQARAIMISTLCVTSALFAEAVQSMQCGSAECSRPIEGCTDVQFTWFRKMVQPKAAPSSQAGTPPSAAPGQQYVLSSGSPLLNFQALPFAAACCSLVVPFLWRTGS
jgi:hypothetical protein